MTIKQWLMTLHPIVRLYLYLIVFLVLLIPVGALLIVKPQYLACLVPGVALYVFVRIIISSIELTKERRRMPWDS